MFMAELVDRDAHHVGVTLQDVGRKFGETLRLEVAADAPFPEAGDLRQLRQIEALRVHPVFQRRGLARFDALACGFGLLADEFQRLQGDGLVHLAAR
jgi:hypothetical protein